MFADAHTRDRRGDEQFALQQIVKKAKAHRVRRVVGLGDLADKQTNRAKVIKTLFDFVEALKAAGVEFDYIQGQHELDSPPWLSCHPWARHAHKRQLPVGPYTAYGLDFQPVFRLQDELNEIPADCDMLLAHQVWADWMGDVACPQGDFAHVPGHVRVVATGDLHQPKIERAKNADGADMVVVSPGATCAQKIDEPHEHFVVLVDAKGKFTREALHSRVFIDLPHMLTEEDMDGFVETYEEYLAEAEQTAAARDYPPDLCKPYLRYTYKHTLTDCVRRVEKLVGTRAILYARELPPEDKVEAGRAARLAKGQAVTPLSVLAQEVDPDQDPEAYELLTRTLNPQADPAEEFAKWRKERLADPD